MLLARVVRLVRQAEAALVEIQHVPVRLGRVAVDVEQERPAHPVPAQLAEQPKEALGVGDLVDLGQLLGDRRQAAPLHLVGVHEAAVQVTDQLGRRAGRGLAPGRGRGGVLHDRPAVRLRAVPERVERAVHRAVVRDDGGRQPLAVHVPEEVVLGPGDVGSGGGGSGHWVTLLRETAGRPKRYLAGPTARMLRADELDSRHISHRQFIRATMSAREGATWRPWGDREGAGG